MPTTQPRSAVICKLNEIFSAASVDKSRFVRGKDQIVNQWNKSYGGYEVDSLKDQKHPRRHGFQFSMPGMQCCGIEELDMQALQKGWSEYKDDSDFRTLVCRYIRECVPEQDNRVLIVGVPVEVGNNSMYNIDYYRALKEVLEEIGFRRLGKEYKNQNSGNTIVAMVGQLP